MNWQTIRRETGLVEHVCEHGVGHPCAGSALWLTEAEQADITDDDEMLGAMASGRWMVHGCDGCCSRGDFPGWYESLREAHRIIRARAHTILQMVDAIDALPDDIKTAVYTAMNEETKK